MNLNYNHILNSSSNFSLQKSLASWFILKRIILGVNILKSNFTCLSMLFKSFGYNSIHLFSSFTYITWCRLLVASPVKKSHHVTDMYLNWMASRHEPYLMFLQNITHNDFGSSVACCCIIHHWNQKIVLVWYHKTGEPAVIQLPC